MPACGAALRCQCLAGWPRCAIGWRRPALLPRWCWPVPHSAVSRHGCQRRRSVRLRRRLRRTHIQCVFPLGGDGVDVKGRSWPPACALAEKAVVLQPDTDAQTVQDAVLSAAPHARRRAGARWSMASQLQVWKDVQGL